MLIKGSRARIADNSGGLECEIFQIYGGSKRRFARVGDIVKVAIKAVIPNSKTKKGTVSKALIIRTVNMVHTFDGHIAYAGENAVVLITENFQAIGTRIFGFASRNAFKTKYATVNKMASLCSEVY